jgi:hypothetical protein
MKTYVEVKEKLHSFLNSARDGDGGQLHTPAALHAWGRARPYPLYGRLGGFQGHFGRDSQEKNLCPHCELNPGRPPRSQSIY